MVKAAAIYVRISDDRLGDMLGVTRQLEDCRRLAERKGWTVAEEYVDDDRSAFSGKLRPRYRDMLADLKDATRDAVIVYDLDRLIRQPAELEQFFQVCDAAGVRALASVSGDVDLSQEDGRFFARIMGAVAHKESADKSRRLRRKHQELAEQGKNPGGGRSFGYTADYQIIEQEALIIRDLAKRFLAGDTTHSLALQLNRRGIKTVHGSLWRAVGVRRLLGAGRIAGLREHHGVIMTKATWEAIIMPEESRRIRAMLAQRAQTVTRAPRRYVLAGLAICGLCGGKMESQPKDGSRRYRCPSVSGCGRIAIVAEPLERFVLECVICRLDSPEMAEVLAERGVQDPKVGEIEAEVHDATQRLNDLAAAYGASQISVSEWMIARQPLEARLASARKRLERLSGTEPVTQFVGTADLLRKAWDDVSIERRQAIFRTLIAEVRIAPAPRARRFSLDRVNILWLM